MGGQFVSRSNPDADDLVLDPENASVDREWPAVRYELRAWDSENLGGSHNQRRTARGPYQAAVVPGIADIRSVELPPDVVTLVSDASADIARFDAEAGVEIAPFSAILLRTESAASSEIEELTAGAKAIALAELGDRSRPNASLVAANTAAMVSAIKQSDNLNESAILAMHTALLGDSHPEWTGAWRDQQVWVGGFSPHTAMFVPPHHDRVPKAMEDLVRFGRRDDLPYFVQAAVAHAQFETIHPFPDGNGRVGRALIHAVLRNKGLTRNITVPVSAGLLVDTRRYFEGLDQYRDGDTAPIVRHMAEATSVAIVNGRHLVDDIHRVREKWGGQISARRDSRAWAAADLLLRQPAVDSALVQRELGIPQQAADRAIGTLVDAGVLQQVSGTSRDRKWVAPDVLTALDDFAKRAGRRVF